MRVGWINYRYIINVEPEALNLELLTQKMQLKSTGAWPQAQPYKGVLAPRSSPYHADMAASLVAALAFL